MGVVCKDAWKNNYRGNSSSKPPVIYDSCYLSCAIAPVSLTRAASCYLPCAIAPVSLTRASSCYLSCVIAPVSLTRASSCYLSCVIAPVSLTRAASCYLPCAIAPVSLTRAASCYLPCAIAPVSLTRAASCYLSCAETPELLTGVAGSLRTDDSTDLVREWFVAQYLSSFTKIKTLLYEIFIYCCDGDDGLCRGFRAGGSESEFHPRLRRKR